MAKKIEMLNDQQEVVHPLTSSDCVIMENGKTLEEVMGDGIATPTVTHEGASFQVGVGDSNIEVVDGDVAGMTLEGKTYQNILPKPTTLIMETDEKEFKINDKIDNNIVLDDNVAEIATIKGQTYVNAVQEESANEYVAIGEELNGQSITTTGKPEGIVKNATLEGLTLVNTIQEPSGADTTVLDLDADINAQYTTIDNTVQGGIHGTKLVGQTIVRLNYDTDPIDSVDNDGVLCSYNSTTKIYTYGRREGSTVSIYPCNLTRIRCRLRIPTPGQVYTLILTQLTGGKTKFAVNIGYNTETSNYNTYIAKENTLKHGIHKIVFTMPSNIVRLTDFYVRLVESESQDNITFKDILLLEGDYSQQDINYRIEEGMQSVEVPSVKTTGKNLFDIDTMVSNYATVENGVVIKTGNVGHTAEMLKITNLEVGKTYTLSCDYSYDGSSSGSQLVYCLSYDDGFYNSSKNNIKIWVGNVERIKETFVAKKDTVYLIGSIWQTYISNIQLEEGSTASTYEPYKSSTAKVGLLPILETEKGCYYSSSTGAKLTNSGTNSVKLEVQGLSKVYVKVAHSNFTFWDSNNTFISGQATITGGSDNTEGYLDVPNNAVYMRCAVDNTKIAEVYEAVVLRKVGDVQDELDLETGKLTQRVKQFTLNETLNNTNISITKSVAGTTTNTNSYNIWDSTLLVETVGGICDTLPTVNLEDDVPGIVFGRGGLGSIFIKTTTDISTLTQFGNWLKESNVTVVVPKVESIKTVNLSIVDQDNNTVKSIQTHPTLTHVSTSSQGLIPNIVIPSQLKYPTIIKPSTTYTVQLKQTTVNSDNPLTINLGGTTMAVPSTKFTITTPETLTSQDVIFTGRNNVIGKVVITEGDTTGIEYDFFEGVNDVNSPSMYATGKNLFDVRSIDNAVYDGAYRYVKIPIKRNTTYTFSLDKTLCFGYVNIAYRTTPWGGGELYWVCHPESPKKDALIFTNTIYDFLYINWSENNTDLPREEYMGLFRTFQLEEGSTATSYEPYKGVTIEQSIDSIPLTSSMFGQGYYDYDKIIKGMSIQQTPLGTNSHYIARRIYSKSLIKVKPNSKYKVIGGLYGWFLFFDKNGNNTMKRAGSLGGVITNEFITDSNTYYVGLVLHKQNEGVVITLSDIPSDLTLQEVTDEIVLRSIGDVKDTLNLTTGEYVQRIGEVILDDSTAWLWGNPGSGWNQDGTATAFYSQSSTAELFVNKKLGGNSVCDRLTTMQGSAIVTNEIDVDCFGLGHTNYVIIRKKGVNSPEELQTWLKQNPLTVQYELATPIIKKVNLTNTTKLPSYTSTTHYDTIVSSNSLVPNIKIPSTVDYNVAIKPSTQYTIRANATSAMSVNLGGSTGTLANGKVTLTTPSTLAHNGLKLGNGKAKEVMVIEGSEIKGNVPFFNGMKNVQMGGIKLVNIAREASVNSLVSVNANKTQFTYTASGSTTWGNIIFDKTLLKPKTLYTIYVKIISNTSDNSMKVELGNSNYGFLDIPSGFTGLVKQTVISSTEVPVNLAFYFRNASTSGQQVVIQNPMIIEGDWTHLDEIPYIESEMIIEQPIIRSQGKNLFDKDKSINGGWIDGTNGSIIYSPDNFLYTMDVKPNTTYTASLNGTIVDATFFAEYSGTPSPSTFIRLVQTGSITTSSTTKKIILAYSCSNFYVDEAKNKIQIEEGSTATTYEPFKHQTLYSNRVIGYEEGIHYGYSDGTKYTNGDYNSILADVEGLSIAYVTNGASNFTFWDKDNVFISGKLYLDTSLSSYYKNGFIAVPSNAKYMRFASEANNYVTDAYTKATVTGELPLRSLPNGVCDTLNLVTGEYVQRVGEIVLDGVNVLPKWKVEDVSNDVTSYFDFDSKFVGAKNGSYAYADKFIYENYLYNDDRTRYAEGIRIGSDGWGSIRIFNTRLKTVDKNGFVAWLKQNPVTVQYELDVPIVRKIGLTAKGNYREQVLDGSETWAMDAIDNSKTVRMTKKTTSPLQNPLYDTVLFTDDYHVRAKGENHGTYEYITCIGNGIYISIYQSKVNELSIQGCTQWLSQNPIKVGYITSAQSSESYSNIHKPIFFNNANVQYLPNNVDIQPTLTLQSRSRNSYVMDMMKANTRYTLKALKNSNSFTIDGASYGATTNGTFTSPSTLTNKLMITGQDVQELMIIEGDVTGKQLPYYKGIRSSFDNTHNIEVLSQTRNLFNYELHKSMEFDGTNFVMLNAIWDKNNIEYKLKPNTKYTLRLKTNDKASWIHIAIDGDNTSTNIGGFTDGWTKTFTTNSTGKVTIGIHANTDSNVGNTLSEIQLEEGSVATPYQPHKENSTIINMSTRWETVEVVKPILVDGGLNQEDGSESVGVDNNYKRFDYIPVQPNDWILIYNNSDYRAMHCCLYDINKNFIKYVYTDGTGITIPKNCYFIRGYSSKANTSNLNVKIQRENPTALNKLPNGVKDELIINRATSSVKLIRRVGKVVLDGSEEWFSDGVYYYHNTLKPTNKNAVCDKISISKNKDDNPTTNIGTFSGAGNLEFYIIDVKTKDMFKEYLKRNPITVYYELAEPVVTEISLKGYPYVYKDGSVQLNTEIPHTTKVKYNVNQEHLINGQNETIIRHDKQIDNLYDYIELYLEEEYRMELFRMQLELSL